MVGILSSKLGFNFSASRHRLAAGVQLSAGGRGETLHPLLRPNDAQRAARLYCRCAPVLLQARPEPETPFTRAWRKGVTP